MPHPVIAIASQRKLGRVSVLLALAVGACGGGGGSSEDIAAVGPPTAAAPFVPIDAPVPVAAGPAPAPAPVSVPAAPVLTDAPAPVLSPASGGTGQVASEPAPELTPQLDTRRQPRPPWPTGPDAPRQDPPRSLNWFSEDGRLINFLNATCEPQPDCVIPDGDLNVRNRACDEGTLTGAACTTRLKLYDDPIFPEDRIDPRPPIPADPTPPGVPVCTTTFRCPAGSIDPATQQGA